MIRGALKLLSTAALIAYPFIVFTALRRWGISATAPLLLALFALRLATSGTSTQNPLLLLGIIGASTGILLTTLSWLLRANNLLLFYPVAVSLLFLALFSYTLLRPPTIIARLAQLTNGSQGGARSPSTPFKANPPQPTCPSTSLGTPKPPGANVAQAAKPAPLAPKTPAPPPHSPGAAAPSGNSPFTTHYSAFLRYTTNVTKIWCAFFLLNAGISTATALSGNLRLWTLYNGAISYILIALLFAAEYITRKKFIARHASPNP